MGWREKGGVNQPTSRTGQITIARDETSPATFMPVASVIEIGADYT